MTMTFDDEELTNALSPVEFSSLLVMSFTHFNQYHFQYRTGHRFQTDVPMNHFRCYFKVFILNHLKLE